MVAKARVLEPEDLDRLIGVLRDEGRRVIGPVRRDGAIVYDEVAGVDDLPAGWTDEQDGGAYRLRERDDGALFSYVVGPHSFKRFLLPPRHRLFAADVGRGHGGGFEVTSDGEAAPSYAFVGIRSCELHAIAIQDRVFLRDDLTDTVYARNRDDVVMIAVTCGEPGGTCFCASMGTGPHPTDGYDIVLTELVDGDRHELVAEAGTPTGERLLIEVGGREATPTDTDDVAAVVTAASAAMGRTLDTTDIRNLLVEQPNHPRWDEVAQRCLACANCTLVCPTCFCTQIEDTSEVTGGHVERWRRWDSCFTLEFTYTVGGSVRTSTRSRYRQWMTHKLASWIDQFSTSGCVGCGRCITWCPVGIDITEEAAAIRETDTRSRGQEAVP